MIGWEHEATFCASISANFPKEHAAVYARILVIFCDYSMSETYWMVGGSICETNNALTCELISTFPKVVAISPSAQHALFVTASLSFWVPVLPKPAYCVY